jgi:hypothetical protein
MAPAIFARDARGLRSASATPTIRSPSVMSRLTARLERLEAVLKPKGKLFVFVWQAEHDGPRAEREAAFRAEHGVQPHDELVTIILEYERRA